MSARTTAIDTIANHKVASTQAYLEHAGENIYGQYVFHEAAQRQYLAKPICPQAAAHDRRPGALRPGHRGRGGPRRQGVGDGARRHPLHALVRAHDRLHGREARLVPDADRRGRDDRRVLRQEPAPGRAGRQLLPVGRHPRHLRGARLHRVGRHLADLPPGRAERRHAHHPDRVRLVHGRGARPQDPDAALPGGGRQGGAARPALVRQRVRHRASSPTSAPSRSTSSSTGASRSSAPTSSSRAARCSAHRAQGPGAGGPVLRPDPRADPRVHDGSRPRAVADGHPARRPATTRWRPASSRWRRCSSPRRSAPTTT